jgi:hypothetical protein
LLLQNEYLAAENRILRSYLPARLRLSDPERSALAEIGKRLGRRGLEQVANLGHGVSDQTVANVLRRYGIAPAPKRCQKTTWKEFISAHLAVLAGTDFFTVEVLTWRGLATYYVLILPPTGDPARQPGGYHPTSHRRVDDANGPQRDG